MRNSGNHSNANIRTSEFRSEGVNEEEMQQKYDCNMSKDEAHKSIRSKRCLYKSARKGEPQIWGSDL